MRVVIFLSSLLLVTVAFAGAQNCTDKSRCDWISAAVLKIDALHAGMTRTDLKKLFREDGGISTRRRGTFVYIECPFIKVDVEFDVSLPYDFQKADMPNDRIKSISKPYLAQPTAD